MSNVLTLYFGGSGQGLDKRTTLLEAYKNTMGPAAFFPGPGAANTESQRKNLFGTDEVSLGKNKKKALMKKNCAALRKLTGDGWNRTVCQALALIFEFILDRGPNKVTINVAGHSRGSITIIMLMNDIFRTTVGAKGGNFSIQNPGDSGKVSFDPKKEDFDENYKKQLQMVFKRRTGSAQCAKEAVEAMEMIAEYSSRLEVNIFMFDPVAGTKQAETSRKKELPNHSSIRNVRVLRMESGGVFGTLSTGMPKFKSQGFIFLGGDKIVNLNDVDSGERYLIPMAGMHGECLLPEFEDHFYVGKSYVSGFLSKCGTKFASDWIKPLSEPSRLKKCYKRIYAKHLNIAPGGHYKVAGKDNDTGKELRQAIHTHHGVVNIKDKDGKDKAVGIYLGDAVNAHHKYLQRTGSD
ncbi:MAG: hypothetical protein AAFU80_15790 [Pseudomonadota bacterium]